MTAGGKFEFRDLSKTSLGTYLREISRIPLLTREEEVEVGKRARQGDPEALHELVEANLRFVVSVANKYTGSGIALLALGHQILHLHAKFQPDRLIQ